MTDSTSQLTTETPVATQTSSRGWLIWAVAMTFVLFQFTLQLSSGVLIEQVAISFKLSASHAGVMSASYYYIYVLLQVPAGILADRFGARRILSIGSFACGLGCLIFATSSSITMAEFGRLVMGGGGALSFVGVLYLVQHWFPVHRFAMMVGLTETVGLVSSIGGSVLMAEVITDVGWRETMMAAGIISITIALFCWLIIRDSPTGRVMIPTSDRHQFIQQIKGLVKNVTIWLNGIYNGLVYAIITVFTALWGIPFLSLKYNISLAASTTMNMSLFAGAALMCPIVGWLAGRFQCHRTLLFLGALLPAIIMTVVIYTTPPIWLMFVLLFSVGVCMSPYVLNFAIADSLAPDQSRSTCIGITNGLCMSSAPIFQVVVGSLLDFSHRDPSMVIVGQYQLHDYHTALATFPVILVIAAIISLKLRFTPRDYSESTR